MNLEPGDRIGTYRIEGLVGRGGFAEVYRAFDARLNAMVAIKVLTPHLATDPEQRTQFVEEARRLRALNDPRFVTVFDIGETETGQPYFVMTYADQGSLEDRLTEPGRRVDTDDVDRLVLTLTEALAVLHAEELVHRDIKPGNILLVGSGLVDSTNDQPEPDQRPLFEGSKTILIGDLGMIKDLSSGRVTRGAGSFDYAAPEQLSALSVVDTRSDIYAASATVLETATSFLAQDLPSADRLAHLEGIQPRLAHMLRQGMAANPDDRPQTIHAWSARYREAVGSPGKPTSSRWTPAAIVLAAISVAGLAGFGGALLTGRVDLGPRSEATAGSSCVESDQGGLGLQVLDVADDAIAIGWTPSQAKLNINVNGRYLDTAAPEQASLLIDQTAYKEPLRLEPGAAYEVDLRTAETGEVLATACALTSAEPSAGFTVRGVYSPTGLAVTDRSDTSLTVTWDLRPGAAFHNLTIDGAYADTTVGDTISYTFEGLAPGTSYELGMRRLEQPDLQRPDYHERSLVVRVAASTTSG